MDLTACHAKENCIAKLMANVHRKGLRRGNLAETNDFFEETERKGKFTPVVMGNCPFFCLGVKQLL